MKTICDDVPCVECGYDLRSLTVDSRCPECGRDVAGSVAAYEDGRAASRDLLCSADVRWVRSVIHGMFWMTLAVVIGITALFLPLDLFLARDRKISAALSATYWVLSWFGVWEISRREPGNAPFKQAVALRVCMLTYAAVPFVAQQLPKFLVVGCVLMIVPTSVLFYEVVRGLALRMPSMGLAIQTRLLAFAMPFVSFIALMSGGSGDNVPPTVFGMLALVRPFVRNIVAGNPRFDLSWLVLIPTLAAALLPLEFLVVWWFRGRHWIVTSADARGKTAASSRP